MTPRRRPSRISSRNFFLYLLVSPCRSSVNIMIHLGSVHYRLKCFYRHVLLEDEVSRTYSLLRSLLAVEITAAVMNMRVTCSFVTLSFDFSSIMNRLSKKGEERRMINSKARFRVWDFWALGKILFY